MEVSCSWTWRLNFSPNDLSIQCNANENPSRFICVNWQASIYIYMKFQKLKKNQDNSEKQSLWAFTTIVSQDSRQMHGTCLKCSTGAGRVKEADALETHRNTSQTSLHRNGDTHVNRWSWVSWMSICKKSALTPTSHQTQKSILNESYS